MLALAVVAVLAAHIAQDPGPTPKDVFSGVVTLDQNGNATITLPTSVMAQETDFTYQATGLNESMPNLHLKSELNDGSFTVAGGTPEEQVTWQLFAVREAP